MSIWASVAGKDQLSIPQRDAYTGDPVGYYPCHIDVATSWHDVIRFSMHGDCDTSEALLTVPEARRLISLLEAAIVNVETFTP